MNTWLMFAMGTLMMWGISGFLPKIATNYMNPASGVVFQIIGNLLVGGGLLLSMEGKPQIHTVGIVASVGTGVFSTLGLLFLFQAMSRGKASLVAPIASLFPFITILLSVFLLNEAMSMKQSIGAVLAILAILLISA